MPRALPVLLGVLLGLGASGVLGDDRESEPPEWSPTETRSVEETSFGFLVDLFSIGHRDDETRVRVLDLMVVSLLEIDQEEPDYFEFEILDVPLVTVFEIERDGADRSTRVLDVPFFSLYRSDRDDEGHVDTHLVRLPLIGSLYHHERNAHEDRKDILFLIHLRDSQGSASLH